MNYTKINDAFKIWFLIRVYLICYPSKLLSSRNTKYYENNTVRLFSFSRVKERVILYFVLCVSRKCTKLKNIKNNKMKNASLPYSYVDVPTLYT